MRQAYLSAPIINSKLRRDDFCSTVLKVLDSHEVPVFAPQLLEELESSQIYHRDIKQLQECDFLIAEVTNPSLGVGMEIMLAIQLEKPVLIFHHSDAQPISRMLLGADGKVLFKYTTMTDVEQILHSLSFDRLVIQKCAICDSQIGEAQANGTRCVACSHLNSKADGAT